MLNRLSPPPPVATDFIARLNQLAADESDRVAYTYLVDGETDEIAYSYFELDRRARAIGQRLMDMGMSGERALLLFPPGLDFVSTILGCFYAGVVAVPAFPPRRNRNMARIQAISKDADAKLAITVEDHISRVTRFVDDSPELKKLTWIAADKLTDEAAKDWKRPNINPDSLAVLQYTSGSTGTPKGVMLTHGNLIRNCQIITHAFGAKPHDVGMSWLPAYHDMGLIGGILNPIYISCTNVLMSPVAFLQKPVRWLQAVTRHGVTISGGPNFAFDYCTKKISDDQLEGLDLKSWAVAYNGAEPVRRSTIDDFCRKFGEHGFKRDAFYPCYGMAESTLMITGGSRLAGPVSRSFDGVALDQRDVKVANADTIELRPLVGCGSVPPNADIRIVNSETRTECPPNQIGEIWVASPSVGQGYFNKPEETKVTFKATLAESESNQMFLRTGDLGFWGDGQLYVTGRIKDLITIRGVNRYPQDIEMTVEQADQRLRTGASAAFTVDLAGREQLIIVSEVERIIENNWDDVIKTIRRRVTSVHELAPDAVVLIRAGSIPKTSSGKIQRHACRDGYLNGSLMIMDRWFSDAAAPLHTTGNGKTNGKRRNGKRRSESSHAQNGSNGRITNGSGSNGSATNGLASNGLATNGSRRNGNGKANGASKKSLAAATNGNGHANGAESSSRQQLATHENLLAAVYHTVQAVAQDRADSLTPTTSIVELGLDSLERLEIANRLEDQFGGSFPEHALKEMETCEEVAKCIALHLGNGEKNSSQDSAGKSTYHFADFPEYQELKKSQQAIADAGMSNPFFATHEGITRDTTTIGGREYINFSSYNYIGMSGDPDVIEATQKATEAYGTSCSASRLVSGEKPVHRQLEMEIARFLGVEDAITLVGGHATNETTIGHLCGNGDLILHDSLAHNSILQGAILSGARRRQFPHNDWQAADQLLTEQRGNYRRVLIVIEGAYSMDGDYPDLKKFVEIKNRHRAMLMVDEAHSIGTMGATGRGISEFADVDAKQIDIWMGTLSKSFGSCGGYIAGSKELVELLKYTAPGFVYSVGLSPPNAAAALASIRKLQQQPERVARCQENAQMFLRLARAASLNTGSSQHTPVIPVVLGNSMMALWLSEQLLADGINVQPILYPAVAEAEARLRFFVTSEHSPAQIENTISSLKRHIAAFSDTHCLRVDKEKAITNGRIHANGSVSSPSNEAH